MNLYYPLNYWFKKGEVPSLEYFRIENINNEHGLFLGIDACIPLYQVNTMQAQNLATSWKKVKSYVDNSYKIITEDFGEDLYYIEEGRSIDVDKEIIREIEHKLGSPPVHCYPIYLITVGSGSDERLVYVGKTSSSVHRFSGGHRVALELHHPKYEGMSKKIYFGAVVFLDYKKRYMPLEWIQPYDDAHSLLLSLEAGLIYYFSPELNKSNINKNNSRFPIKLHIQNFSQQSDFLHDSFITL